MNVQVLLLEKFKLYLKEIKEKLNFLTKNLKLYYLIYFTKLKLCLIII